MLGLEVVDLVALRAHPAGITIVGVQMGRVIRSTAHFFVADNLVERVCATVLCLLGQSVVALSPKRTGRGFRIKAYFPGEDSCWTG